MPRFHRPITPYLFLAPAAAILGVFFIAAMIQVVVYSTQRYTVFEPPRFVGVANYRDLFHSDRFWFCLGNSFFYLLVTPVLIVISLAAAMTVNSLVRAGRWIRVLLFLPVITPTVVAAIAWRAIFKEEDGLLNVALAHLGIARIAWLSGYPWVLITAMTVTLWKGFGYFMTIFLAGLLSVPRELEEAATIDGADRWKTFQHVVLPALRPTIALVAVISSIGALKVFDELFVTVQGAPVTYQTAVPLIYQLGFEEGNYGLASAAGVVLFVFILILSVVNLRLTNREKA